MFKRVKGTVDFYPEELAIRNRIFDLLREIAIRYNFKEIESPAIEELNLLTKKEGEEIKKQIFVLKAKGNEKLGLRFDLTVPATRMFITKQRIIQKPVKWFYISRMWRYEQPQRARLREFYQLSAEIFGSDKPEADAEVISLAIDCLLNTGLTKDDFAVKINNRKLLEGVLKPIIKDKMNEIIPIIDKKNKVSENEFMSELKKIALDKATIKRLNTLLGLDITQLDKLNVNELAKQGLSEIKMILRLLGNKKEFVKLDLSIVRGLAYYTGTVFEVFDREEKYRALAGGGRYDNLVKLLGGEDCPATGFAIGYSPLLLLLEEKGLLPKIDLTPDYYIATVGNTYEKAIEIANVLRKRYRVEINLTNRNLTNQLRYADNLKARKVIIVGEKELIDNVVTVKDMKNGKEKKVNLNSLLK